MGFLKKVGAALTVIATMVGAIAGLHSMWTDYEEQARSKARLEIVESRTNGAKVELLLRNPGTTSVFVNKAAFFISKHHQIGFARPITTGPVPIPALYQVTFPPEARPDTAVEVHTSFNIAGGDSGAFSIEVKVPPVSRGQDRATHVYEAVVVLLYNEENKVSSSPFTVKSSTPLR